MLAGSIAVWACLPRFVGFARQTAPPKRIWSAASCRSAMQPKAICRRPSAEYLSFASRDKGCLELTTSF